MFCDFCRKCHYLKYSLLDVSEYNRISNIKDNWFCTKCLENSLPFIGIEIELDYINCIYNNVKGNNMNANIIKNAAQFRITSKFCLNSDDIDPDKQFAGEFTGNGGRYYLIDEFNSTKCNEYRFSLLHLNARSLNKNIDQLALFINALNHKLFIISISETWENKDIPSKPHLPGYSCVSIPRSGRGGE